MKVQTSSNLTDANQQNIFLQQVGLYCFLMSWEKIFLYMVLSEISQSSNFSANFAAQFPDFNILLKCFCTRHILKIGETMWWCKCWPNEIQSDATVIHLELNVGRMVVSLPITNPGTVSWHNRIGSWCSSPSVLSYPSGCIKPKSTFVKRESPFKHT